MLNRQGRPTSPQAHGAADPAAGMGNVWLALVMFTGVAALLAGAAFVGTKAADVH